MKIAALLTGRGNNTLQDKNIIDVLGHPILYYPANAAKKCSLIDNFYCSSDDDKILSAAAALGYKKIVRPAEFARPDSQHIDCILHGLEQMKQDNYEPDILVVLLANNPTIQSQWITECIEKMMSDQSVTAVVPAYQDNDHHPMRAKRLTEGGALETYIIDDRVKASSNRQDLPKCFFLAHNFWALNVKSLLAGNVGSPPWSFMGNKVLPYEIDESFDIHQESDLYVISQWIKNNYVD